MAISWMMEEAPQSAKEAVLWIHEMGWTETLSKSRYPRRVIYYYIALVEDFSW
jgi:hypothetical protein